MRARVMWALAMATMVLATAAPARSAPITISVGGTSITVDGETQDGLFNWIAGGADQLSQQWIWFRQGNTPESSLDTLSLVDVAVFPSSVALAYLVTPTLGIAVRYDVSDGSQPTINETILVQNLGTTATELSLFLYSAITVNGDGTSDIATGGPAGIAQTAGGTTINVTPASIVPNAFQIDFFPDLLDLLNDGVPTNLNNSGSGLGPSAFGLSHAFQWNLTVAAGGTQEIEVTKALIQQVPQPGTWLLLAIGLVGAGGITTWRARRRGSD